MVTAGMSDAESVRALDLGVGGIFPKHSSPTVLIQAIRKVMAGETWLDENAIQALVRASKHPQGANQTKPFTERETQVLQGVFEGLSNKEIGARLNISESSVKAASSTIVPEDRGKNPQPARPDCAGGTRRPLEVDPHLHDAPWLSFAVKPTERNSENTIPTPEGSNVQPLRGRRSSLMANPIRRFHLRLMISLPFGEA